MPDIPDHPETDPPPQPPEWPGDDACCGNGCDTCIFDLYEAERERYRIALRQWQARQVAATPPAGLTDPAASAPPSDLSPP